MVKQHRLVLGKVDYNHSGRRNCEAAITWTLEDGRFSMSAEIWNPRHTDISCGGQCVDTVAGYFPDHAQAQRMVAIWRQWHLNDMTAGSPAQQALLDALPAPLDYTKACEALAAAGLNPDPGYLHDGKPYAYGSAWLRQEIPAEIVAEIESWSVA